MPYKKQVIQINQQGEVVNIWQSTRSAHYLNQGVQSVLANRNKTAGGYKWAYYTGEPIEFPKVPKGKPAYYHIRDGMFVIIKDNHRVRIRLQDPLDLDLPKFEPFKPNERTLYTLRDISELKCPRKRKYLEKQRIASRKYYYKKKQERLAKSEKPGWIGRSLHWWVHDDPDDKIVL